MISNFIYLNPGTGKELIYDHSDSDNAIRGLSRDLVISIFWFHGFRDLSSY